MLLIPFERRTIYLMTIESLGAKFASFLLSTGKVCRSLDPAQCSVDRAREMT